MSSETDELCVGTSPSGDRPAGARPDRKIMQTDPRASAAIPMTAGSGTSSADGLSLSLSQVSPDPFLGEFEPEPPAAAGKKVEGPGPSSQSKAIGAGGLHVFDLDVPPSAETPSAASSPSGVSAVVTAFESAADKPAPKPSTSEHFATLDLNAPPPWKSVAKSARRKAAAAEEDDENLPVRGSGWLMVSLASYASAVTLGLLWVLWGHRIARENPSVEPDSFPPAETGADPGHRASQSRRFVPPAPLSAEKIVTLGQPIKLSSLEVTPMEISAGPVLLRHEINEFKARRGGNDALMLKLRLKNVSSDWILVPLDENFIRTRDRGIRDSFIETGPTQQIDMFPLAIASEWSIAGQEFRELRPGESYETEVVSAPDSLGSLASAMTWRVRLRTDVKQTETLGIRFREQDIRRKSPREIPELPDMPARPAEDDDRPDAAAKP